MGKRIVFCGLLLLLAPALLLTGCTDRRGAQADVKEAFLTAYFTMDGGGRYSRLEENGLTQEGIEEYYQELEKLTTEEFLNALQAKREPYSFDKFAAENGIGAKPTAILLAPYGEEKNVYTYSVTLEVDREGQTAETKAEGQITVEERDGRELVSGLYISPSSKFLGPVE